MSMWLKNPWKQVLPASNSNSVYDYDKTSMDEVLPASNSNSVYDYDKTSMDEVLANASRILKGC